MRYTSREHKDYLSNSSSGEEFEYTTTEQLTSAISCYLLQYWRCSK